MDLIRTCLICNNHYPNREEKVESGLGEEKGWSLFCLLWKLLGISVEGESSFKRVRVNLLKGQPWCGECHAVLDDLRRLHEEIEKAKRRQETVLEGVKFLVSDNLNKSEHLDEEWAAHRLQLVKYCLSESDGSSSEDNEVNSMEAISEGDASLPNSPSQEEQKFDIRDCRVVLRRLLPEEYEKKVAVPPVPIIAHEDTLVRRSSRRKTSESGSSDYGVDEEGYSDPDFEPELAEADSGEVKVEEEGTKDQGESEENPLIYKCRKCKMRFSDKESRLVHHGLMHKNDKFPCEVCGQDFRWKNSLRRHVLDAHTNGPRRDKRRRRPTAPVPLQKPWICEQCGLKFSTRTNLAAHAATHSDLRPFKCDFCEKRFKVKDQIIRHQRRIHREQLETKFIGPILAFPCEHCDKTFLAKGDLDKHIRLVHWRLFLLNEDGSFRPGVEYKRCSKDGCDYKHPLQHKVNLHFLRVHKHEQSLPFTCQYCGKGFKNSRGKKDHELIHVNKESRPFVCEICGNSFAVPKSLYIHKKLSHEGHRFPSSTKRKLSSNSRVNTS